MKELSQTYSKFERKHFEGNSEFRVIVYCPILKNDGSKLGKSNFYAIAKIFIDPVHLGRN